MLSTGCCCRRRDQNSATSSSRVNVDVTRMMKPNSSMFGIVWAEKAIVLHILLQLLLSIIGLEIKTLQQHHQQYLVVKAFVVSTTTIKQRFTQHSSSSSSSSLFAINVLAKKAKLQSLREEIIKINTEQEQQEHQHADGDCTIMNQQQLQHYMNQIQQYDQEQQQKQQKDLSEKEKEEEHRLSIAPGPIQTSLMRRKGTITLIGEYKRKLSTATSSTGSTVLLNDIYKNDILLVTSLLREYGANGISIVADERMGLCTYKDIQIVLEEQRRLRNNVPGPISIINNDYIVDSYQIIKTSILTNRILSYDGSGSLSPTKATTGSTGSSNTVACMIQYELFPSKDEIQKLLHLSYHICQNIELIVVVSTAEQGQVAIEAGATMICIVNSDQSSTTSSTTTSSLMVQDQVETLEQIKQRLGGDDSAFVKNVCFICMIHPRRTAISILEHTETLSSSSTTTTTTTTTVTAANAANTAVYEIEDVWYIRDKGFHCAYIPAEVLFKGTISGSGATLDQIIETPNAILKSMKSKSSLKFASPQPKSGRGEGAREYLGDILM